MKKLTLLFIFWTALLPLFSQVNYVTVTGTVTDISNGNPIANHAVTIQVDSSSGFFYYTVVYTMPNGFYLDTIVFNLGTIPTSNVFVSTLDCNQNTQMATLPFGPGNQSLIHDFQICNTVPACNADFTWQSPGNLSVQYTDASTGGPHTTQWYFGDGYNSTDANPLHTYSTAGTYAVRLHINDTSASCFDSITKYVSVGDSSNGCIANFYAVPDTGNPMNVHFYDQSVGNNISYWHWEFGDGLSSNDRNPAHLYAQSGIYYVCLTIRSNDSTCYSVRCDTLFVNGNNGCQAQFTWYSDSLNTVYFTDLSTEAGYWFWDFGDPLSGSANTSTLQNPIHMFTASGTFSVCLTIHNHAGTCESTWCTNVPVGGNTECNSYFTYTRLGLTMNYEGHMVNGLPASYAWSFGDGTGGTGHNIAHTYATAGIYYVSLTTTMDSTNCSYTSAQTVQVGDSTQFHQIYGQVLANNFPLTAGFAMIFSIDSTNTNPYNDVSSLDSSGIYSFNYVPQGNFVVWVIPYDSVSYLPTYYGDVTSWEEATIISLGTPSNPYNIHMVPATSGLTGNGGINGHINTGKLKSGLADKIRMILLNEAGNALKFRNVNTTGDFDFSTLGYGVYFLRAELPGVTSDLIRVEITQDKPIVTVVMTYSGTHLLGFNENQSLIEGIVTYPNPVDDQLTLSMVSKKDALVVVSLCDLTGRIVISESRSLMKGNNTLRLNTAQLQSGIFFLRITSDDGTNLVRKVIKTQ